MGKYIAIATYDETVCELKRDSYAFEVMVHRKTNSFLVPSGKAGKDFILELAIDELYQAYTDNSTLHSVALMYCLLCVSSILLL